jgi:hypothetical protein
MAIETVTCGSPANSPTSSKPLGRVIGGGFKLRLFGLSCSPELFGTIKPEEFPPINQRIVKGLKYIGFDVREA